MTSAGLVGAGRGRPVTAANAVEPPDGEAAVETPEPGGLPGEQLAKTSASPAQTVDAR